MKKQQLIVPSILLSCMLLIVACGKSSDRDTGQKKGNRDVPAKQVRNNIEKGLEKEDNKITLPNPKTDEDVQLTLDRIRQKVEQTSDGLYRALADFKDADGKRYEVEFLLRLHGGDHFHLDSAEILKIDGKPVSTGEDTSNGSKQSSTKTQSRQTETDEVQNRPNDSDLTESQTSKNEKKTLYSLKNSTGKLIEEFNRHSGRKRLLMILSPT